MPNDEILQNYRRTLAATTPSFLLSRRFVAAESWTKAITQDGTRYLGLFREQEPDLPTILKHRQLLILGEAGAGKSTTASAIVLHLAQRGQPSDVPVFASLKSYKGNLRNLLLQTTPAEVLDAHELTRSYILDGIDEVPAEYRGALPRELNDFLATDSKARLILTSRQAFAAQHLDALPAGLTTYHLLDFDDNDIRACATRKGIDADVFLAAVRDVDCEEEVRNPFVLDVMLERYKEHGSLSRLRADNVGYVVDRLIQSRPLFNATRQHRALCMLAITCETAARNELTPEEALRVLLEAIEFPPETARQLLDEFSHSILVHTAGRITFQMRSYGEYLAAKELHDKPLDRLKELAFIADTPIDSWLNTVTYLAEMNDKVRLYFARQHPEWLINVSPSAFNEDERTALTRKLLCDINETQTYLVGQQTINLRRLSRLLTPTIIKELQVAVTSTQPHEVANALVLLSMRGQIDIVPQALRLATEHRDQSSLRYAAIIALINTGEHAIIDDLIAFADPTDTYHIHIVDAIGSLCTPADFERVLPLLESTNAGLSSAYYHFRELNSKEALTAAIQYLTANPTTLNGYDLDSYLEPIINLIPKYWDEEIGTRIGVLLAAVERAHIFPHHEKLAQSIVAHAAANDHNATTVQAMLRALATDNTPLRHIAHLVAPLITVQAAQWINDHAPQYAQDFFPWLPLGPACDLLDQRTPDVVQAHEQARAQYIEEQRRRDQETTTTREQHQNTLRTSRDINAIISACERLQKEHWPELAPEQREWLSQQVTETLVAYDLAHTIRWETENRLTQPRGLNTLLNLTDYYHLHLSDDVPLVLALRSWPGEAIRSYYRTYGFTPAAQEQLAQLLGGADNNITRNGLSFLRESGHDTPIIRELLIQMARDTTRPTQIRCDAIERLANLTPATETLLTLAADPEANIRGQAFRQLVGQQHRGTIQRALATLTDDALRAGEVPIPNSSPLDWITKVAEAFAINDLRDLRLRTLALNLWRVTATITSTIANIDKACAATVIRRQHEQTPPEWQQYYRQEASKLERAARIDTVRQTPFDAIIRKLKGATSMIRIKVWCEGSTDRPVFQKLFTELGEHDIADTIGLVGGWPNLVAETQPERWLDGCRQAIIIMDGDNGRKLTKRNQPLTETAKTIDRRFANHPLKLHVMRRYGIENYFPRHACEAVLQKDLSKYFPIPPHKRIEEHFSEPQSFWQRLLNRAQRRQRPSFYLKSLNRQVAGHLTIADIQSTDLADILEDIKQRAGVARQY